MYQDNYQDFLEQLQEQFREAMAVHYALKYEQCLNCKTYHQPRAVHVCQLAITKG